MSVLICPICKEPLTAGTASLKCTAGHSFDISAKGYVNLLLPNHGAGNHGDNRDMLRARRDFLQKGYYRNLSDAITNACARLLPESGGNIADCCCGEGYYTKNLHIGLEQSSRQHTLCAFDISKDGVKMAASKNSPVDFFVASVFDIPISSGSIDVAVHSFAPYCDEEIARILKPGGYLVGIIPGRRHLYGLKEVLYTSPYENDETGYESDLLENVETIRLQNEIVLQSQEDIHNLFLMTPYFWRTTREGAQRLAEHETLSTQTEFIIKILKKSE